MFFIYGCILIVLSALTKPIIGKDASKTNQLDLIESKDNKIRTLNLFKNGKFTLATLCNTLFCA